MNTNKRSQAIRTKLKRLSEGHPPRIIDLFSGCGGLSLGFHAAGFQVTAAIENDPHAARSHSENFHGGSEIHGQARDIIETPPRSLARQLGDKPADEFADVIIGGPPCQAFARVGRSKLREVIGHPEAFTKDKRALLYLDYLKYVADIRPLAVIMENVPDMLNHGGRNLAQEVCVALDELGYTAAYTLLNSVYYGVPQMRERMFLIAFAKELEIAPRFPATTHWIDLPGGYQSSRNVALRSLNGSDLFTASTFYKAPPTAQRNKAKAVTAEDALGDLPVITSHLEGRLKRGARRLDEWVTYPQAARISDYAKLMRDWPAFPAKDGIRDHAIRYLPRDYAIFHRMNPGDQYPEAHRHALNMFQETLTSLDKTGEAPKQGTWEFEALFKSIVPPYDPGKFPNKWRKMWRQQPARTLMAHLGKDSYSHIHYDSAQARTISVREAARLQSFPDGFRFSGTMNPAFRQIGNAVPPLLAKAVGTKVLESLHYAAQRKIVTQEVVAV